MSPGRTSYRVPVAEVISETDQARTVVLDLPADMGLAFAYQPGQFLTVRVPSDRVGSVARCYSLCSSPDAGERLAFTVKRVPDGYASDWILRHVTAGTVLDLLPPAGTFTPRSLAGDFLLFAGGSGITPVMSILKSALIRGRGRIALIYANGDDRSVIFAAELARLQTVAPGRLLVAHWLDSLQGQPSAAALRELARPYAGFDAYICGPDPYMAVVRQALGELGVPAGRVHVERFQSLAENPFEATQPTGGIAASLEVSLDDQVRTLDWPAGTRMLDVLIDADLDPPFSCREGICGACACRLVSGEVQMAHNQVLEDADLAEGYILACQAVAVSAHVSVSY